ncbi:hypothetical protein V502_10139 [Neofusicoccum parvum]|uniref:Uncharacterized protein n=1 Tax=Neofusicoccum parvum TaxID=310453 RepID=A0ACB5SEL0_9PEZI|nr:hypothetical protein V502_10139 [Neofusicoccum parvum]
MSTDELAAAKDYIKENLGKGFIKASRVPFGSPILMARKANRGFRFCMDYRRLNAATKKNKYPLPLIDETLARLTRARYFSKIDVRQAFHRIRIYEDSKDLTTFRTRYGSYRYNVLPFRLCNGPATFQQYMNEVIMAGLDNFCSVFIDDILVYNPVLRHFDPAKPIFIEVDSSDYVSGGVLSQKDKEGKLHLVAYFSKKLSNTECNYTIYDKELFAIVFTDHETLKTFITNKQLSRRQIRWAEELAEYNFKIIPITGKRNERADALSRRE